VPFGRERIISALIRRVKPVPFIIDGQVMAAVAHAPSSTESRQRSPCRVVRIGAALTSAPFEF
jgi:hypothetical protein